MTETGPRRFTAQIRPAESQPSEPRVVTILVRDRDGRLVPLLDHQAEIRRRERELVVRVREQKGDGDA